MAPLSKRLVSLDVFRGITIAAMILVNNPGSWRHIYAPLRHAEWHGWTPTDLIFPFFLFIVGVAIVYALSKRVHSGESKKPVYMKIVRRTLILFALGLLLTLFPYFEFDHMRIPGVLQRIALVYLLTALFAHNCKEPIRHFCGDPYRVLDPDELCAGARIWCRNFGQRR